MNHPLHLTASMLAFAMSIEAGNTTRRRARNLYRSLLGDGLDIRYNDNISEFWRPHGSKTASAVFDMLGLDGFRFATSLEYTLLYVALGRELGLSVQAVRQNSGMSKGTDYLSAYIASAVVDDGVLYVVDLASRQFYRDAVGFTPLSDAELEAYHHGRSSIILQRQRQLPEAQAALHQAHRCEAVDAIAC